MSFNARLYKIYAGMKQRCTNPNYVRSKDYLGRGIEICSEWLESYKCFEKWAMNNGYADNLSIDRIDNNGNYCPENCRWVDAKTQANNRRDVKKYEYNGEILSVSEWARKLGKPRATIEGRLLRGWSIERALTEPPIDVFKSGWKSNNTFMKAGGKNDIT